MAFHSQDGGTHSVWPYWPDSQIDDQSITLTSMDPLQFGLYFPPIDLYGSDESMVQDGVGSTFDQSSRPESSAPFAGESFSNTVVKNPGNTIDQAKRTAPKSKRSKVNNESAAERRKSQVRQAQQAYRQRREATAAYLREDCKRLRDDISKMQHLFQVLHNKVEESETIRQDTEVASLMKYTSEQFHLLDAMHGSGKAARGPVIETMRIEGINQKLPSDETSSPPSTHLPSNSSQLLSELSHDIQTKQRLLAHSMYQINQPPAIVSQPKLDIVIPFSLRLRHEAIQRGYHLISLTETPHAVLSQGFRFCIFRSTRTEITKHMHHLLEESKKAIYHEFTRSGSSVTSSPIYDLETTQTGEDVTAQQKVFSWMEPSPVVCTREPESNSRDGIVDYIDPEAVVHYLEGKGVSIQPGSSIVTISLESSGPIPSAPSLFGELRGSRDLKLNMNKLIHELLKNATCLNVGPGFRTRDIDDAIEATLLAAI